MIEPSDSGQAPSTNSNAVSAVAAEWIQRRHFWDWSEKDQSEFNAWLAASPLHLVTYLRVESAWKRTERLAALNSASSSPPRATTEKHPRSAFFRIAVVLAVICLGAGAAWYGTLPKETTYVTSIGGHETIALADGSQIELNTDSIVRTRIGADRRVVVLDKGEAFFKIHHDAGRPLVVFAAGHRITDIGTKFLIRETPEQTQVTVFEGSAQVDSANAQSATLKAGDMAIVSARSLLVAKKPRQDLANAIAWQRGMLIFSQTPLVEVANELNRYNTRKLIIADANVAKDKIGGTFPTDGIDEITAAARLLFGLRVQDRGNDVVISR